MKFIGFWSSGGKKVVVGFVHANLDDADDMFAASDRVTTLGRRILPSAKGGLSAGYLAQFDTCSVEDQNTAERLGEVPRGEA